jgi:hypothetical protein
LLEEVEMRALRNIALAIACLGTASCGQFFADFRIANETNYPLLQATLRLEKAERRLGEIPPHSVKVFRGLLSGEGAAVLTYSLQGKRVAIETCYQARRMPLKGTLWIRTDSFDRHCA